VALIAALIFGALLNMAFSPFDLWFFAPVSLVGLFLLISNVSIKVSFIRSLLYGFAFFAPLLHWSGSYVGWVPWIALSVLQASIFSLIGIVSYSRNLTGGLRFSGAFLGVELLRMQFPFGGFGWGRIGHTQTDSLTPFYPIIGVAGISFLVSLFSSLIAIRRWRNILVILVICSVSFLIPKPNQSDGVLKIAAVQGGVDQLGLDYNQRAFGVLRRHISTTTTIASDVDLIVWPENASDIDPEKNSTAKNELEQLLNRISSPLLVGAVQRGFDGPENVSILYEPDGRKTKYLKQDLAPFGEYMPLRSFAEWIAPEAKRVVNFKPGKKPVLFAVKGSDFATLICFELLDDDLVRQSATGASFLINQTNNATFGRSNQASQQLQIARSRSAELGKDLIAVSTTGFTAHISNSGQILKELPQFQSGALTTEVRLHNSRSPASYLPSWIWWAVALLTVAFPWFRKFSR
jgi:apolipoprotein N-acyltransferase